MSEALLKAKMKEWLDLKKAADELEKAREDKLMAPEQREEFRNKRRGWDSHDELKSQIVGRSQKGVSHVGIETRRADARIPAGKAIAHGYARVSTPEFHKERAKAQHKQIIDHIKSTSPNLPKSEALDKGLGQKTKAGIAALSIAAAPYAPDAAKQALNYKLNQWKEDRTIQEQYDKAVTSDPKKKLPGRIGKVPGPNLTQMSDVIAQHWNESSPKNDQMKPAKSEDMNKADDTLDYKKMKAEFRQKQKQEIIPGVKSTTTIPASGQKSKTLFDPNMSGKVDYKKVNKVEVVPADDSDPMVINTRATFKTPKTFNGPNIMNAFKAEDVVKFLKNGRKKG